MSKNIAIDGPAGAGKSTIAKKLAKDLGFIYVDTGAMYRTLALYFIRKGISSDDTEAIEGVLPDINVELSYIDGAQHVLLNGEDVSDAIRQEEVGNMASSVSTYPFVREKLLSLQRDMAEKNDVVMDGRDIGTTILPNADVKIFLTASVMTRAERRCKELIEKGQDADLDSIARDIKERDERDMNREISPLVQAEDAVLVDSSEMTIDQVVSEIKNIAQEKGV